MGFVPDDKAKGRQIQGKIATVGFRVEHFAGKLLVGGTVSGKHLDGVQDVDLRSRFRVLWGLPAFRPGCGARRVQKRATTA